MSPEVLLVAVRISAIVVAGYVVRKRSRPRGNEARGDGAVAMYRLMIGVMRWVAAAVLLAAVRAAISWLRRRLPRRS